MFTMPFGLCALPWPTLDKYIFHMHIYLCRQQQINFEYTQTHTHTHIRIRISKPTATKPIKQIFEFYLHVEL